MELSTATHVARSLTISPDEPASDAATVRCRTPPDDQGEGCRMGCGRACDAVFELGAKPCREANRLTLPMEGGISKRTFSITQMLEQRMGVLSDKDIFAALDKGILSIDPLTTNNVQPASLDLTLHHIVEVVIGAVPLDVTNETKESLKQRSQNVDISSGYTLNPGAFVTGYSEEKIRLTSFLCGRTYNRNSLARYGLDVTASAYMNPGFHGRKIIVIRNFGHAPIILRPLMRICQLQIISLESRAHRSYDDRHDFDKIYEIAKNNSKADSFNNSTEVIDNPLSKFMDEQIRAAAARI